MSDTESAGLIAAIRECDAKMSALKEADIESGRGAQMIYVATDLLAEQSRNALAAIPIIRNLADRLQAAEAAKVEQFNAGVEAAAGIVFKARIGEWDTDLRSIIHGIRALKRSPPSDALAETGGA